MKFQLGLQHIFSLAFWPILLFVSVSGNELEDFLTRAMKKYPAWLNEHALDPYFAKDYNLTIDYKSGGYTAKMAMWDIRVTHHSKVNTDLTTVRVNENGEIEINYKIQSPVKFWGSYFVRGEFGRDDPYQGQGDFQFTSIYSTLIGSTINYNLTIGNLQMSADCFIDMANTTFTSNVDIRLHESEFKNVTGGAYASHYRALLGRVTAEHLDDNRFAPFQQLIDMYFTSLFEETPFCSLTFDK